MFNSPAGGSGELFPSPAKGHTDEGLSGEQNSDAQRLINSALSGTILAGLSTPYSQVNSLLLEKEAWRRVR